jgi:hypothetical protein
MTELNAKLDSLAKDLDAGRISSRNYLAEVTAAVQADARSERKPIQYIVSTPPNASPSYFHNRIWQLECLNKSQAATIQNLKAELRRLNHQLDRIVAAHEALGEVVEETWSLSCTADS